MPSQLRSRFCIRFHSRSEGPQFGTLAGISEDFNSDARPPHLLQLNFRTFTTAELGQRCTVAHRISSTGSTEPYRPQLPHQGATITLCRAQSAQTRRRMFAPIAHSGRASWFRSVTTSGRSNTSTMQFAISSAARSRIFSDGMVSPTFAQAGAPDSAATIRSCSIRRH